MDMKISSRAQRIISTPSHEYGGAHVEASFNMYSAENLTGNIPMAIAENKFMRSELIAKVNAISDYPDYVLNYTSPCGLPDVRKVVAEFLTEKVFEIGRPEVPPVSADHLTLSAGCVALLYQLSLLLFEQNETILIPGPYYPAFDKDFLNLGEVVSMVVHHSEAEISFGLSEESLTLAYESSVAQGRKPKALLLTNPNNPMGTIYSPEDLLLAVSWCRARSMHLLCDEVYALSVYDDEQRFHSIVSVLDNQLGDDVHVMWSLSKDFGGSGLRVGVLYTQNADLQRAIGITNDAFMCSNLMQMAMCRLLSDRSFIDFFIVENKRRLRDASLALNTALKSIKTILAPQGLGLALRGVAGVFVFVDFRSLLLENSFEGERQLFSALRVRGVVLTPGEACHAAVPGYFRLCFAWVDREVMLEGVRRIAEYAASIGVRISE